MTIIEHIAELKAEFTARNGYEPEFLIVGGKYIEELRQALSAQVHPGFAVKDSPMSNWKMLGMNLAISNQDDTILRCS